MVNADVLDALLASVDDLAASAGDVASWPRLVEAARAGDWAAVLDDLAAESIRAGVSIERLIETASAADRLIVARLEAALGADAGRLAEARIAWSRGLARAAGRVAAGREAAQRERAARIAHDLRTPLNAIIGFADILLDEALGLAPAEREEFARDILTSGRRMSELVDGLVRTDKDPRRG
jgi:signal transduction histidine kinase